MGVNMCCCCSSKDAAITIGIWSLVYSVASLLLFGWQTGVLNHCRAVTMAQANLQCEWSCPCVGASTRRTATIIEGLFVIQVLCLIAAFFLLFASAALIYGIHTWSKYLVWPWFPCIISSILASLAYCIMWWCGDVRDYWIAITVIEIIVVFINIYCVVVVMMYYRRINATTDEYEGKDRRGVRYKINRNAPSRRDLLDSYEGIHQSPAPIKSGVPYKPIAQPYPVYPSPYSQKGMPQTPIPLPTSHVNTPYPVDPNEMRFEKEPRPNKLVAYGADPVGSWVREQQSIDRSVEANSEPISPSRQVHPTTLQHSRSVPSLFDGTLVSHRDCHHNSKHRSSSRRRKSRNRYDDAYSSETEPTETELTRHNRHRSSSRRRHRSRPRYEESEMTYDSEAERERRRSKRKRHGSHRSSKRKSEQDYDDDRRERRHRREDEEKEKTRERRRDESDRKERDRRRDDDTRDRRRDGAASNRTRRRRDSPEEAADGDGVALPLSGGISIPHHIVIPPSSGERGPDGRPLPQKFEINSEITINYDRHGRPVPVQSQAPPPLEEPYRRRHPMAIQSTI